MKVLCAGGTIAGRKADSPGNAAGTESVKSNGASWRDRDLDIGHLFRDAGDFLDLLCIVAGSFYGWWPLAGASGTHYGSRHTSVFRRRRRLIKVTRKYTYFTLHNLNNQYSLGKFAKRNVKLTPNYGKTELLTMLEWALKLTRNHPNCAETKPLDVLF